MANIFCFKLWFTTKMNLKHQNLLVVWKFWISVSSIHSKILGWCLIRCLVIPTWVHIRRNGIGEGHQEGHHGQGAPELAMTAVAADLLSNSGRESVSEAGLLAHMDFSIHSSVWTWWYTVIVLVRATSVRHRHSKARRTKIHDDVWHLGACLDPHSRMLSQAATLCLRLHIKKNGLGGEMGSRWPLGLADPFLVGRCGICSVVTF